jgi:hypothetical protein
MNITILRLSKAVYVAGRGAVEMFQTMQAGQPYFAEEITELPSGNFRVKAFGKKFLVPNSCVAPSEFEDTTSKEPVQKK